MNNPPKTQILISSNSTGLKTEAAATPDTLVKTVAEQAYSDLLFMPPPQTGPEFRRAIVKAVMIGRQLESDFAGSPWQASPPTEAGVWEAACEETDFEPQRVRDFRAGRRVMGGVPRCRHRHR